MSVGVLGGHGSAAALVQTSRFSTDDVTPDQRFDAWRTAMATSHDIKADSAGFHGEVVSASFGRMLLHRMTAAPQEVERSATRARRDGLEHFVLHVSEVDITAQAGTREIHVPAGAISVNDLSRPSLRASVPERNSLIVGLSRDLVREVLPNPDGLHGLVLDRVSGGLLADLIRSTAAAMNKVPAAAAPGIALATAQLFAACVAPSRRTIGEASESLRGMALVRAKRYIEAHLAVPTLGPESVAAGLGCSKATLFRVFKPLGGVTAYIQHRRLGLACQLLAGATRERPRIADVAYAVGFADPAHFSRVFRARFGLSPRDAVGNPELTTPDELLSAQGGFAAWVRNLG